MANQDTARLPETFPNQVPQPTRVLPTEQPTGASAASSPPKWGKTRWAIASVLAVLGALAVPLSVMQFWVQNNVLNKENFIATYAPLAEEPIFQDLLANQTAQAVVTLVEENLPLDAIENTLADLDTTLWNTADWLEFLPYNPLGFLSGADTAKIPTQTLEALDGAIHTSTLNFYQSPAFVPVWESTLDQVHTQLVATLQGNMPSSGTPDGVATISLDLGPLSTELKTALNEEGAWWAKLVPTIEGSLPIIAITDLPQLQSTYKMLTINSVYLQISAATLLVAAVAVAPRRWLMLTFSGLLAAASSAMLIAALPAVGRSHFQTLTEGALQEEQSRQLASLLWSTTTSPLTGIATSTALISLLIALLGAVGTMAVTLWHKKPRQS